MHLSQWWKDRYTKIDHGRSTIRLFVYGTLREGYALHSCLDNCRRVGEGWLTGFKMFAVQVPYVVCTNNPADRVFGEIYEVEVGSKTLERIDGIEAGYTRTVVDQLGGIDIYMSPYGFSSQDHHVRSGNYADHEPRRAWYTHQTRPRRESRDEFRSLTSDEDDLEIVD